MVNLCLTVRNDNPVQLPGTFQSVSPVYTQNLPLAVKDRAYILPVRPVQAGGPMPGDHDMFPESIALVQKIVIFQIGRRIRALQGPQILRGNAAVDKQIFSRRQNRGPAPEKFQFLVKLLQHTAAVTGRLFSRRLLCRNAHVRQHLMKNTAAPDPLCPV